jgi:hypothetical protein
MKTKNKKMSLSMLFESDVLRSNLTLRNLASQDLPALVQAFNKNIEQDKYDQAMKLAQKIAETATRIQQELQKELMNKTQAPQAPGISNTEV